MLLEKVGIALLMMFLSTMIHALFMIGGSHALDWRLARFGHPRGQFDKAVLVWALTIWMFFAIVIEVWLWAAVLIATGAVNGLEPAVYFSLVCFTTLGFGDITLPQEWRLLSALIGANGFLMFGWSTAFMVELIRKSR